ncbi:MAG: hypothetical protein RQ806_08430 [Erythrobacter sp.]|nr:hypothetical protein [Erythrobacter sp.]
MNHETKSEGIPAESERGENALKLANALLERPRILVLSRLFDLLDPQPLQRAITELREQAYSTVIYFSNRQIDLGFDRFLYLEAHQQRYFDNFNDFCAAANHVPLRAPGLNRGLTAATDYPAGE